MLQNTKYDVFLRDSLCVFAVQKNSEDTFKLVSSKNLKYIYPINSEWTFDGNFFSEENGEILTQISLAKMKPNLAFIASLKIDELKIPSFDITKAQAKQKYSEKNIDFSEAKLNIFRQGTENINGVIDVHMNAIKCIDGIFTELVFKIYYQRTSYINVEKFIYELDDEFIDKEDSFIFTVNSNELFSMLYINGKLRKTFALNPRNTLDLSLNMPLNKNIENMTMKIGDTKKALQLRNAMMYNKYINEHQISAIQTAIA